MPLPTCYHAKFGRSMSNSTCFMLLEFGYVKPTHSFTHYDHIYIFYDKTNDLAP